MLKCGNMVIKKIFKNCILFIKKVIVYIISLSFLACGRGNRKNIIGSITIIYNLLNALVTCRVFNSISKEYKYKNKEFL